MSLLFFCYTVNLVAKLEIMTVGNTDFWMQLFDQEGWLSTDVSD